jgi:hypothetical protein
MQLIKFAAVAFSLALTGCVPFLHPLTSGNNSVFNPLLVGDWTLSDDTFHVTAVAGKSYEITWTEAGKRHKLAASLVPIGSQGYLDVVPVPFDKQDDTNDFYLPAHWILKLNLEKDRLLLAAMNAGNFNKAVKSGALTLKHEMSDGEAIVTAGSAEIERFLREHGAESELFEKPGEYRRVK